MKQLLEAGVHFGHQTRRWNPKMKKYIYCARNGIYIIDLQKTVRKLREVYRTVVDLVKSGGKILFLGTKKQASDSIKEEALRCGMPYISERWLGGTFTNFDTIRSRVYHLQKLQQKEQDGSFDLLTKKEASILIHEKNKLERYFGGIKYMDKIPEAIFIVDTKKEEIAVKEARSVGVKVFAMLDTNCDPDLVDYAVPSNDDAIRAVRLICEKIANAVIEANQGESQELQDKLESESRKIF
ncbi:MAG: 30S ribosomal protein S2 [Clostridiales bacterium]|nr:30S ribosomal protein S2 [Clostridiales bacterium]